MCHLGVINKKTKGKRKMIEEQKEEQSEITKYTKKDIIETPKFMEVIVMNIKKITAKEAFGDKAEKPEQEVLSLNLVNEDFKYNREHFLNYYGNNYVPESSNLGKFISRYDGLDIGTKCDLLKNSKGHYDIALDK